MAARAEEQELPSCSREATHGQWRIRAAPDDYWIERDTDAHGAGDADIITYSFEDGSPVRMGLGIRLRVDEKDGVDVSLTLPRDIRKDGAKYSLTAGDSGKVYLWRASDEKAFPVEVLMLVDGRNLTRGTMSSYDTSTIASIGVGTNWSGNPLPAMKSGREAVVVVRNGADGHVGPELIRMPIGLDGVTVAARKGAELQREAKQELEAGQCSSGCYLTTACCEHLGRPDACWELETLRWYRDRILANQADGPLALATYYRMAPEILAAMPDRGMRRTRELARIYWGTVIPCALLVRLGAYRLARRRYERTFRRLRSRWLAALG